ncbi:MAG: hypothetical protein Q8N83_17515 [Ignavibacteria bacterium]|nr:hypothetical protein [Ignavibacteria bacterium]
MKKLSYIIYLLLFFVGCKTTEDTPTGPTTDPAASSLKSQQAYESLEIVFTQLANGNFNHASDFDALNFKTANDLYKSAIELNPDNKDAHLGAALTEILCVYSDTAVNRMVKQWESFGNSNSNVFSKTSPLKNAGLLSSTSQMVVPVNEMAKNLLKIYTVAKVDPPLISDMQRIVRDAFLPRINYAIEQLGFVESSDTFKFRVSGKMQGDSKLSDVYLYPTEILMSDALLQGVKSMLEGMLVYKFELADYKQASLVAALQQNSTSFFYLASDGTTHSQNAKASINSMIDKLLLGITKLESISGHKTDAVIKLGNDGLRQSDLDTAKKYLNKMKTSMSSAITVHLDNVGTDETPMDIQVFLGNFFDNPVANPKASFLPAYTVTASGTEDIQFKFNANNYAEFNFPDPTFGGMFPGMTNDNMKKLMQIDKEFGFRIYFNTWWNYSIPNFSYTVKIVTDTKTYSKTTDEWGMAKFVITDQNNVPYKVWINGGSSQNDKELTARPSAQLMIKAKSEMDHSFRATSEPDSINAYSEFSQIRLEWNIYELYWVMKGTGATSTPTDYQTVNYQNMFWDSNVTNGITYRYQLRNSNNPEDYNMGYGDNWEPLVFKDIKYSNIVTITKQ